MGRISLGVIEACNPCGNMNFDDYVGLAQPGFVVAGWSHRGGFCEKLLPRPTEPISDGSGDGHAAGPARE